MYAHFDRKPPPQKFWLADLSVLEGKKWRKNGGLCAMPEEQSYRKTILKYVEKRKDDDDNDEKEEEEECSDFIGMCKSLIGQLKSSIYPSKYQLLVDSQKKNN